MDLCVYQIDCDLEFQGHPPETRTVNLVTSDSVDAALLFVKQMFGGQMIEVGNSPFGDFQCTRVTITNCMRAITIDAVDMKALVEMGLLEVTAESPEVE